jgi:hypothetical protein
LLRVIKVLPISIIASTGGMGITLLGKRTKIKGSIFQDTLPSVKLTFFCHCGLDLQSPSVSVLTRGLRLGGRNDRVNITLVVFSRYSIYLINPAHD